MKSPDWFRASSAKEDILKAPLGWPTRLTKVHGVAAAGGPAAPNRTNLDAVLHLHSDAARDGDGRI